MIHTESLFTPEMSAAMQEQSARALILACQSLADQLSKGQLHKDPVKIAGGLEALVKAAQTAQVAVVDVCRDQRRTWEDIAQATGLTRQGAMHRWQ